MSLVHLQIITRVLPWSRSLTRNSSAQVRPIFFLPTTTWLISFAGPWDDEYPQYESPVSATSASDNPFGSAPIHAEQPSSQSNSKESSVYSGPIEGSLLIARNDAVRDGYVSPAPPDDITAERRDERRYRLTLAHPYHESLKLACESSVFPTRLMYRSITQSVWTPSQVFIGDVGYHKRPHGSFVRLFSAFDPDSTSTVHGRHPPPLKPVPTGNLLQDKRNIFQRGLQWFGSFLRPSMRNIARRYDFLLRAGHKRSLLVAESTVYVSPDLGNTNRFPHSCHFHRDTCNRSSHQRNGLLSTKKLFWNFMVANIIFKERIYYSVGFVRLGWSTASPMKLFPVIGTLDTRDYALCTLYDISPSNWCWGPSHQL